MPVTLEVIDRFPRIFAITEGAEIATPLPPPAAPTPVFIVRAPPTKRFKYDPALINATPVPAPVVPPLRLRFPEAVILTIPAPIIDAVALPVATEAEDPEFNVIVSDAKTVRVPVLLKIPH